MRSKRIVKWIIAFKILTIPSVECDSPVIILVSDRKSGSHLAARCLQLLTGKNHTRKIDEKNPPRLVSSYDPNLIYGQHLTATPENMSFFSDPAFKGVYIYRDPRAQLVSHVFYVKKIFKKMRNKSFDYVFNHILTSKYFERYSSFLAWTRLPNIYTVSFEELIGPTGGGSLDEQIKAIRGIADHIGVELTDEKLEYVLNKLFGHTWTFRSGQIDEWKIHFTPERKELFKNNFNTELLIELGYEKNCDW